MAESPKSSRRDFLKGRAALDALRKSSTSGLNLPAQLDANTTNQQSAYLEHYSKNAMACEFAVLFNMKQYDVSGQAAQALFDLIESLEDQMSIYRSHSEVSRINQNAFTDPVEVEPELFSLLKFAERLHNETDGAFDITTQPLSEVWGFNQRSGRVPEQSAIDDALKRTGFGLLRLDASTSTVKFLKEGVSINLGGIGKGFALDRAVSQLGEFDISDFILHGGQSSVVARGAETRADRKSDGWVVGISHPTLPDVRLAEVTLRDSALGTSGTARQGFFEDGKRYGHIIDPRTGWPTDHILSTTVISPSAALSDALATAFFVMTLAEIEEFCIKNPNVAAILTLSGKKPGDIELCWFNLAENDWRRLA